ncbi:SDR family oxidoreductase [Paenibacillus xylaniclasticus]|uniref:SDR family oxidoreductase n=1 Tax=Paenibacillus xylaniclasticus TaxID=588083 RepID=UPI000FD97DA4|nr:MULTISPECIES: SDR family oxidoreductase [Paenibacillus]GFN32905.1 NAD(P)-dependent oxidoreductase [Paenibacillus curdlanolyticus]
MKLLVTGATGQLGALVVESLLKLVPASRIAVSVRDPRKAEHLSALGVDVRYGDFDKPESLEKAFAGVDRMLMISSSDIQNRIPQHRAAVQAAKAAQVSFIAYTSAPNAQESTLSLAGDHRETENEIISSGIPYSFLRNNWYLENELGSIQAAINGAPWVTSAGAGRVGWAGRRDYAEAAAKVLAGEGHDNTVYELSGKPLTQEELVAIVSEVIGKDVPVMQVDDETYAKTLADAGVPEPVVPFLVGIQTAIRTGQLDVTSSDFEKVLGRPVTPLNEALRTILNL